MTEITHRGRAYRPVSKGQPKEGDLVAVLIHHGKQDEAVVEGRVYSLGEDPAHWVGDNILRYGDGGWDNLLVHIIERAPQPLPEGGIVILEGEESRWVRWHVEGRLYTALPVLASRHGGMTVDEWRKDGYTVRPATAEDLAGESS